FRRLSGQNPNGEYEHRLGTPADLLAGYVQSGIVDGPGNAWRKYSREKHKLRQTGYYLQDQMSWDRWRFTLGGRYDRVSVSNIDK
ncbi:TonB-dependent receptor, partial [Salmonella enterica subsp. enterica serovar Anatum]|nr:TonB-dependent receptor [Salmonella enterica subsp. enterica serovar Anatum]